MRIRRLKLSGFKSFVEPCELRIEPGLTGVVGPNGCGKSNLLEALRWAMGEGSPKSLRGAGMDDVIFAGTATRPQRDFAEVSILLERDQGPDGAGGESEVTRRIERGSGSAYRLDGRDVRAKDIALLFADAATGAHSPALVSQGKVGAIIAAKPTERRLLLEEAAGISGLHARRKDAEQKLRATEANLARLDDLLSDQEARSATLRRQARAAERYRQLTEKIRLAEARLVHARWTESDAAATAATAQAARAQDDAAAAQHRLAEEQARQDQLARALQDRRGELNAARAQASEIAHALATARARREAAARRLAELGELDSALERDVAREAALREDAERAIAQLDEEMRGIARRLEGQEEEARDIAAALARVEEESRTAEAALADLLARHAAMHAERRVASASLDAARAQVDRTGEERARLRAQCDALRGGEDHGAQRDQALARAEAATRDRDAAEQARVDAESRRAEAADRRDEAESLLAAARAALSAAQSERDALRRALQGGGGGAVLDRLAARPGYERALAAALGDDSDAAVGGDGPRRWTGSAAALGDPALPEGVEPLGRFVEAPPELARRLAQVGVADRDKGQTLAVGQRLVTLDGRLRRWDGFESTGSGAAAAERLVRANRLAELESQVPALEAALADRVAARDEAVADVEQWRRTIDEQRRRSAESEQAAREAQRAADAAANAIERVSAQTLALEQRLADLDSVARAADEARDQADRALAALPDPADLERDLDQARTIAADAAQKVADARARAATQARDAAAMRDRQGSAGREADDWRRRQAEAAKRADAAAERRRQNARERDALAGQPAELDAEVARLERESGEQEGCIAAAAGAEREAEQALAAMAQAVAQTGEAASSAREQKAAATARAEAQESRRAEYARVCLERFECVPQRLPQQLGFDAAEGCDSESQSALLEKLTADRERIGPVNLVAEQELAEIEGARLKGAEEARELTEAIHRLRGSIGSLNREGRARLLEAFEKVDGHFRSLFTALFQGGQAHLELVESDDPLEAGLEIMAQPPGKRLSALTLLSGGEQALTAIALIFALFLTNPAPICVLDEVDAPLDDANVERFCDLLEHMTAKTDTRYLIVTHNAVTMSRMHRLYGVTMIEKGVSRLVSVDLGGAETLLAAE